MPPTNSVVKPVDQIGKRGNVPSKLEIWNCKQSLIQGSPGGVEDPHNAKNPLVLPPDLANTKDVIEDGAMINVPEESELEIEPVPEVDEEADDPIEIVD